MKLEIAKDQQSYEFTQQHALKTFNTVIQHHAITWVLMNRVFPPDGCVTVLCIASYGRFAIVSSNVGIVAMWKPCPLVCPTIILSWNVIKSQFHNIVKHLISSNLCSLCRSRMHEKSEWSLLQLFSQRKKSRYEWAAVEKIQFCETALNIERLILLLPLPDSKCQNFTGFC